MQHNWGVIEATESGYTIFFFSDESSIFDQLNFHSFTEAEEALRRNGFMRYEEDKKTQEFIAKPKASFHKQPHPNGPIYSSGRFWH